jgi:hypothetical protein
VLIFSEDSDQTDPIIQNSSTVNSTSVDGKLQFSAVLGAQTTDHPSTEDVLSESSLGITCGLWPLRFEYDYALQPIF